jgi:hypothetical protein
MERIFLRSITRKKLKSQKILTIGRRWRSMFKKLIVFLALLVFLVGAAGGCFNPTIPDLSGNWQGVLNSSKNSNVSIRITISNLVQDQHGNFTGGLVTVTYTNPTTQYTISADVYSGNTDPWRARIHARGDVTADETPSLIALILLMTGNPIPPSSGDYYDLAFTFPHMYGCSGGTLTSLVGDYEFNIYIHTPSGIIGSVFDKGTAKLMRP